jgi:acetylglutamate kinase
VTTPTTRAQVLVEALPYIRRFRDATVVVKFGGNAMPFGADPSAAAAGASTMSTFAEDVVLLRSCGLRPVVVHGGGPQISDLMARLGKEPEFRDGLRVTDAETVDIARMVLVGKVNRDIVAGINVHGPLAVGLSGEDAGLIAATARNPDLGFVGDVHAVNPAIVERLLNEHLIPVVSTIGSDATGQAYNINADTVAGALAEALGAERVVYLTDVPGLLRDIADPSSLITEASASELQALIDDGTLTGGMIPKIAACIHAVQHGVGGAHILDGRVPHALLLELLTDEGVGTMIVSAASDPERASASEPRGDGARGRTPPEGMVMS